MAINIPTLLTWARIAIIPLVVGIYYLDLPLQTQNIWACAFFAISAITDYFDGYLARKWKTTAQLVAIAFLLYENDLFGMPVHQIGTALIWIAAVLTLWSMVYYMVKAWPAIRKQS